jgi:hypothetical protein
MRPEDRFRDRPRGRCRVRNRVRLRFRGGSAQSPALPRTHAAFPFVSLCDISTPGCNSPATSQASSELCAPLVGWLALASQLGALPSELAALRSCRSLVLRSEPDPVTSQVAASLVAHRVVAGRRSLLACSRRSALGVSSVAVAGSGAVSGHPGHPSLMRWLPGRFGDGSGGALAARQRWGRR